MKTRNGFTLIELVLIIVIIGILAGLAAPKLIDASGIAGSSALKDAAGKVESVSRANYAAFQLDADDHEATAGKTCQEFLAWAFDGSAPDEVSSTADIITGAPGDVVQCELSHDKAADNRTALVYVTQ